MNWKKYGGGYLAALIAVTLAYYLLDLVLGGGSSSSMMLLAPAIAAIYPSSAFVKDHRRVPSPGERWRLLGLCVAIFAVLQAVQIGVVTAIFSDEAVEFFVAANGGQLAIAFVATLLLEIALMWLLFRFHPGWLLKSIRKADERKAAKER